MQDSEIARAGLVMLGCGKMGGALLRGWLASGLPADAIHVHDPGDPPLPPGVHLNGPLPVRPAVAVIAVKPQTMDAALPALAPLGDGPLYLSVVAGTPLRRFEAAAPGARVVRAMPNTPAAIGRGITAIVGNAACGPADLDMADALLSPVGGVVRLTDEAQIDAVTGVSGSGPAYVFYLIEALAAAGRAQGLPADLALELARATVAGAGALAMEGAAPEDLRRDVTSPGGTTAAGLAVLMDDSTGLGPLIARTVAAAADRARALAT